MTAPPTDLPKGAVILAAEDTLRRIQAFAQLNPAYDRPGLEHISAVLTYLEFVRNNRFLARRVE
jgi:hypothetical protein